MDILFKLVSAVVLDLVFGDPRCLTHPVTLIGRFARTMEGLFRNLMPGNPFTAGLYTAATTILGTAFTVFLLIFTAESIHPILGDLVEIYIMYTCFAARDLGAHSARVFKALAADDLNDARKQVAMMVGRDTGSLDERGVTRAAVESVGENIVDGVTAPLFYAALLGPIGAMTYKAVNTLDSNFGYKNEQYLAFGCISAKVDDAVNWLPARLTGPIIALSALFCRLNPLLSLKIFLRDRFNHSSPNSAHGESAFAGALAVQLGGPTRYQGRLKDHPYIGDAVEPLMPVHIIKANRLMYTAAFTFLAILVIARILITGELI